MTDINRCRMVDIGDRRDVGGAIVNRQLIDIRGFRLNLLLRLRLITPFRFIL